MTKADWINAAIAITVVTGITIIVLVLNLETGIERWARTRNVLKKPEWWHVLEPRQAVIAGLVGLAVAWLLNYYAHHAGYVAAWGFTRSQWKGIGTAAWMAAFAVPYWLVKWWVRR